MRFRAALLAAFLGLPTGDLHAADDSWLYPDFAEDMQLVLGITRERHGALDCVSVDIPRELRP